MGTYVSTSQQKIERMCTKINKKSNPEKSSAYVELTPTADFIKLVKRIRLPVSIIYHITTQQMLNIIWHPYSVCWFL